MTKDIKQEMVDLLNKYEVEKGKLELDLSNNKDDKVDKEFFVISAGDKDAIVVYIYDNEINLVSSKTQNSIASGDNPISLDTLEILLLAGTKGLKELNTMNVKEEK